MCLIVYDILNVIAIQKEIRDIQISPGNATATIVMTNLLNQSVFNRH